MMSPPAGSASGPSAGRSSGLQLRDLKVRYGPRMALDIPELRVETGSCTLVTGPTGCGKSTLALALAGVLEEATGAQISGSITVDGEQLHGDGTHRVGTYGRGVPVAAVWQRPEAQLFRPTLLDEVRAGLDFRLVPAEQSDRRAREALRQVGLDHLDERRDPLTLSGGEQQRLALAAALVLDAPVLVLDEATSQLDRASSRRLTRIIAEARATSGLTVIAVDHRPGPYLAQAERVLVLDRGGCIALDGPPEQVLVRGEARCREPGVRVAGPEGASRDEVVPESSARVSTDPRGPESCEPGARRPGPRDAVSRGPGLREAASRGPGSCGALEVRAFVAPGSAPGRGAHSGGLSFALPPGAAALLVGPNGSGKTTLLDVLAGLRTGRHGHGLLGARRGLVGEVIPSRRERRHLGIGYAPQRGGELLAARTVREELRFALPPPRRGGGVVAGADLDALLDSVGLLPMAQTHPQHLSGGQRQRLSVLLASAGDPWLLLLDEPTSAQDADGIEQVITLLQDRGEDRVTVIATHEEELFARVATHRIELSPEAASGKAAVATREEAPGAEDEAVIP